MGGPVRGRADYLDLGTWNASCSMCGRKRKASTMEQNWQGLYRCPEHNEPRQPQDFARGTKDDMSVPWAQTPQIVFATFTPTFPLSLSAKTIQLLAADLALESGAILDTEGGVPLTLEGPWAFPFVQALFPSWVIPESFLWSWASGGVGITITNPIGESTGLSATTFPVSGVLQLVVTSTLGVSATASVNVST